MTSNKQTSRTLKTPVDHSPTVTLTLKEWEAWRRAAGLHIDPETAEVLWEYTQVIDPYCIFQEIPEECDCVGRSYFARSPEVGVWIWFGDLPKATRDALCDKHKDRLASPAGLEPALFALHYVEQNFSSTADLSEDEMVGALIAGYQAYLDQKMNKVEEDLHNRDNEALS